VELDLQGGTLCNVIISTEQTKSIVGGDIHLFKGNRFHLLIEFSAGGGIIILVFREFQQFSSFARGGIEGSSISVYRKAHYGT
jgi:hypothetical protein